MGRFQAVTRGSNRPELPLKSTENKSVLFSSDLIPDVPQWRVIPRQQAILHALEITNTAHNDALGQSLSQVVGDVEFRELFIHALHGGDLIGVRLLDKYLIYNKYSKYRKNPSMANMTKQIDIPTLLRAARSALNLTQEQLADRLGVSFATVNRWEGGGNKPQRAAMEAILALANDAGVDGGDGLLSAETVAQVTPRRTGRGAAAPTTKPMEQMLWDAACSIRGEKDAAKFKDYLLPLLFLKRLSDVFDDEVGRLAEEYGDRATALEIAESDHSLLRFYLPPEARWAVISGRESFDGLLVIVVTRPRRGTSASI
nr:type I restriction-modification system subunit M N-terminal domain-containing protein [uncultured Pseudomonas sp.]